MSLEQTINDALAVYLRGKGLDVAEVTSFEDRTQWSGGCSTCAFEYAVVDIYYTDSKGKKKSWTYDSSFAGLISAL